MRKLIAAMLMLSFGIEANAAIVADSVAEFSGAQGQSNWYYGYYDGALAPNTFKLLPNFLSGVPSNMTRIVIDSGLVPGDWCIQLPLSPPPGQPSYWTQIWSNGGHPNGILTTSPSQSVDQWAVRRWVSPVSAPITISGVTAPLDTWAHGINAMIYVDGVEVFDRTVLSEMNYSVNVAVSVGSTVDFIIAPNADHFDGEGATKFSAVITAPVPEPSTLALLGAGAISLLGYAWRKRAAHSASMLRFAALLSLFSGCFLGSNLATGGVVAYEGFDYPAGSTLNGDTGGVGFGNAWLVNQWTYAIAQGGLTNSDGFLEVSGNALHHTGLQPQAKRDLAVPLGSSSTADRNFSS